MFARCSMMRKRMKMTRSKIALIGPVYPYKGGIAHYTGLLYRALCRTHDVVMISYKMQYPKLLLKREQKDYSNDSFQVEGTNYMIHTANPFNWLHTAGQIKKMSIDTVIIEWWHPYFAPCYYVLEKLLRHKDQRKLVFICHNVFPHERFPLDRMLTRMVLKQGDGFILHSRTEADDLISIKPDADYRVQVHPTYNAFKFEDLSKEQARDLLGLGAEEKVLLFFGYVRPYKGLKYLIQALPQIQERLQNVKLMVVGDFGSDREQYQQLIEDLGVQDKILVKDGYTPDREVERYFAASDLVVLPYETATQSGIVQIAYGFTKPVIVTNVGGLPEVVTDDRTGLIVEPKDVNGLADAIIRYYEGNREQEFITHIREEEYRFSWDRMTETIESFEA